jgi:hypothetical protein
MAKTRKHLMRKSRTRRLHKRRVSRGGGGGSSKPAAAPAPASASRANREAAREERKAAREEREAERIARAAAREVERAEAAAAREAKRGRRKAAYDEYKAKAEAKAAEEGKRVMSETLRTYLPVIQADPSKRESIKQIAISAGELARKEYILAKLAGFVFKNTGNNAALEEMLDELPGLNFEAAASGP